MKKDISFLQVMKNKGFLNLWINQVLVQLAYNSLNFALIIWVFKLTDSNTALSALMLAVYLPAVILGIFAGVFVDAVDRKKIIKLINLALSLSFISLVFFKESYPAILIITFFVNTLAQFYSPAELSAIPIVAKKHELLVANSLFSITLFSSFLLGFGLAGPLINHLGIDFVFILGGFLTATAFILANFFPSIRNKADSQGLKFKKALLTRDMASVVAVGISEIRQVVRLIKGKLAVFSAILILAGVQAVIGMLAVLVPSFFEKVVQIKATDASLVLVIPLGLGMVAGGFIIGKAGHRFPRRRIVSSGILLGGLLFFIVGIAPLLSPVIKHFPGPRPLPFFYQPPLSAILAFGSFLMGIAMVAIVVPSQTVLQINTPEQDRGKLFSVLAVAMASFTLLPVLFAGVFADFFGAMPIFIAMGGMIAILGFLALKPDFFFAEHHLPLHMKQFLGMGHWKRKIKD